MFLYCLRHLLYHLIISIVFVYVAWFSTAADGKTAHRNKDDVVARRLAHMAKSYYAWLAPTFLSYHPSLRMYMKINLNKTYVVA